MFRRVWAAAGLIVFPFAVWSQSATPERCPEKPWTDDVVAKAIGVAPEILGNLKANRALTNDDVCTMKESDLQRAMRRVSTPRPSAPAEWARFRAMQQADENGVVAPDGLLRALQARKAILARSPQAILGSAAPPVAGISPGGWTGIGPGNIGGRIRAVAIHPTQHNTVFIGSVSGGIWKTTDGGVTWAPVADFMGNLSISSIVFDPGNPNVMYAGTGEGFFNVDAVRGAGIFKSTDGGVTWSALASTNPTLNSVWYYVNRIAIHPTNGNILLAATNSGVYRSTDAGASWNLRTGTTRYADVRFDPSNGNNAVAAPGFGGGFILYSTTAGDTWNNSSLSTAGRAEVGFGSGGNAYASVDTNPINVFNNTGSVYRSTNSGASWTFTSSPVHLSTQGWYNNTVWVDPTDGNHVIVAGLDIYRSTNGGTNFTKISNWSQFGSVHADHHAIVASPGYNGTSNRTIYFGNDGGMYKAVDIAAVTSTNVGWTNLNNGLSITQFYSGAGHSGTNGQIIGGTQDNGSLRYSGAGTTWTSFFGGDGGHSAIDSGDGAYIYGEYVRLQIHRATTVGGNGSFIYSGITDAGSKANFIAPFTIDPNNSNILIAGGESVWRTTNAKGTPPSWSFIQSPVNGGGSGNYTSHVHVAKGNSALIWNGKNNGALYKTTNGTDALPTWNQFGSGVLPARAVLTILVDPDNHQTVYVGFGGYSNQNLWRTINGGTNWTSIGTGLPPSPVRSIQRHPGNANMLYAGTEVGIFASDDGGATWNTSNDGPANVSVDQLFWLNASTLVAATHGRGMFTTVPSVATNVTLTVIKSGAGSGPVTSSPSGISCGSTCAKSFLSGTTVTLTATANSNSVFAGWSGACSGTATCVVSMNSAKSVTAAFNLKGFALTVLKSGAGTGPVTSNPAGISCGSGCTANFNPGTTVTLTATANSNSVFAGWSGVCSGTSTCVVTMDAAKSVTAAFNLKTSAQTLTVSKAGLGSGPVSSVPSGISCGSACSANYATGTTVTLTATANSNSVFAGWSGACTGTSTCVVTMDGAKNVTASFNLKGNLLTVTKSGAGSGPVTSSPSGISCGSACSQVFTPGTMVTLTATPNASSVFAGWSGACAGTSTCVVTMDAAKTVNAAFNLKAVALTILKAGTGSGPVTSSPGGISCGSICTGNFTAGASVTLTATPNANSVFAGWSGACAGTTPTCVVTMSSAKSVTATFNLGSVLGIALDNTLTWATSGSQLWTSQAATTHDGVDAAQSGTGLLDSQVSSLSTTVTGPGQLSHWWKVSSEQDFDFLSFWFNGFEQAAGKISGNVDWNQIIWNIPAGTHTIEFRYYKDDSVTDNLDRGWVDQVTWTPGAAAGGRPVSTIPLPQAAKPAKAKK